MQNFRAPEEWQVRNRSTHSLRVEHDDGLVLKVSPRYRASTSASRGAAEEPESYRVTLQQDWFSRGVHGDSDLAARAADVEEATRVAHEFIGRYERSIREVTREADREVSTVLTDGSGEQVLSTEAATGAFSEVVGYSDDLLEETVRTAVDDCLRLVAHRDGADVDIVFRREDVEMDPDRLLEVLGLLPFDPDALAGAFDADGVSFTSFRVGDRFRAFRFPTGRRRETVVSVDIEAPVSSPSFERSVLGVLDER